LEKFFVWRLGSSTLSLKILFTIFSSFGQNAKRRLARRIITADVAPSAGGLGYARTPASCSHSAEGQMWTDSGGH
jgi:hypothetical protein